MKQQGRSAGRVRVWVQDADRPRRRSWPVTLLLLGLMVGLLLAAISGISLAMRLIVNPGSVGWISWLLPDWEQSPLMGQPPQMLSEIRAAATEAGLLVGNPIYLNTYPDLSRGETGFDDWLLPLYQPQPFCENEALSNCQRLVEVRIYRPSAPRRLLQAEMGLELIDRLPVTGLEEHAVVAPLVNASIADRGSTRKLAYQSIQFIDGSAPLDGVWIHLSGVWQRGSNRIVYGQVIRYDPIRGRLQPLETWTSPAEQIPKWQVVTGTAADLVVDQSIGLEPQFQVYQFKHLPSPVRPLQVMPITLAEAGLDDRAYQHGLLLARNGLWSMAQRQLEASQANHASGSSWTPAAQAQLDLIKLHAQVTQTQADRDWASPRQQILALLIDGRWAEALTLLRTAHANGYTLKSLLSDPTQRLRQRVETALRVAPDSTLQSWGILLTALKDDRGAAIAWLNQQSQVAVGEAELQELLSLLETPTSPVIVAASPTSVEVTNAPALASAAPSQSMHLFLGTAVRRSSITPQEWFNPDPEVPLTLGTNQTWYEIQVEFQDGQRWQPGIQGSIGNADGAETGRSRWMELGLNQEAQIQLIAWTENASAQTTSAPIRAMQFHQGRLRLLSTVEASAFTAPVALALSPSQLSWLQPVEVLTLNSLNQQYPQWTTSLLVEFAQALQQAGLLPPAASPEVMPASHLLKEFGSGTVQLMDVTGDRQLEGVLTLTTPSPSGEITTISANPDLPGSTQTLIFSSQGTLLYSDLSAPSQTLQAIVDLHPGNSPALIVRNGESYQIRQWSAQQQRFE
ncbi:hypothetical protein [Egbenema bharatensis]|uniref:hypothetical protein n=1 Tax=Egbenema bharatensis TaxID=3463334 RepID=UPI003A8C53B9